MVTVTVLFEGGANPISNPNAATVGNTTRLRESFNKLLNSGLENEKVRINASPAYSISNAVKIRKGDELLLIDSDGPHEVKEKRLTDNQLIECKDFVFFMVQRMEAWFLSQPEVIESLYGHMKHSKTPLHEDDTIKDKHPENIPAPDDALHTLLQRHFSYTKLEKTKKLKYHDGKLRLAPDILEKLNIKKLQNTFQDVQNLMIKINSFQ